MKDSVCCGTMYTNVHLNVFLRYGSPFLRAAEERRPPWRITQRLMLSQAERQEEYRISSNEEKSKEKFVNLITVFRTRAKGNMIKINAEKCGKFVDGIGIRAETGLKMIQARWEISHPLSYLCVGIGLLRLKSFLYGPAKAKEKSISPIMSGDT